MKDKATTNENVNNSRVNSKQYDFPTIMTSNITGALCNKLDEIHVLAKQYTVDIICISETWCSDRVPDETVELNGYTTFRRDRQDGRAGGGLICYVKDVIPVIKVWTELNDNGLETIWFTLRPHRLPRGISHITIGNVYHPPKASDWEMCQHLIHCFDNIKQTFPASGFIIVGDFNHMKDKYFKNACRVTQIVQKATHMQSVIDLFYTTLPCFYNEPLHLPGIGLSRHHTLVFTPLLSNPQKPTSYVVFKRNQSQENRLKLKKAVSDINWSTLYRVESCEEKFNIFQNTLSKLIDDYLPVQKVKRNSNDLPWLTIPKCFVSIAIKLIEQENN
jgi:exonuclease III